MQGERPWVNYGSARTRGPVLESGSASALLGQTNSVIPRLRRYVFEVGDAVNRALRQGSDAEGLSHDDVATNRQWLYEIEKHLSLQGLRRENASLQAALDQLRQKNVELTESARKAERIGELQGALDRALDDNKRLQSSYDQLKKDADRDTEQHTAKYDELHRLFNTLTEQANKMVLQCDKQRLTIERLETEKQTLSDKVKLLESHMATAATDIERLQETYTSRIETLDTEANTLRAELGSLRLQSRKDLDALRQVHAEEMQKKQYEAEILSSKIKHLKKSLLEATKTISEVEKFRKEKATVDKELKYLRQKQTQFQELQRRFTDMEAAYLQEAAKVEHMTGSQNSAMELETRTLRQELERWKDSARSISALQKAGVDPSPSLLRGFLTKLEAQQRKHFQETDRLAADNSQLTTELNQLRDSLRKTELDLKEESLHRQAADYRADVLQGELRGRDKLLAQSREKTLHKDTTSSSGSDIFPHRAQTDDSAASDSTALPAGHGLVEMPQDKTSIATAESLQTENKQLTQLLAAVRKMNEELQGDKQTLVEKSETACLNFVRLEKIVETLKSENAERDVVIMEQKRSLDTLQARLRSLENTSVFNEVDILRKERNEALQLSEITREFYRNEAIIFRAIIKTLLGWRIHIDMAPSLGEDITVTLKPRVSQDNFDDDAALIFRVKSKLPSVDIATVPREVAEIEICNLFTDEDFDMHLDGRFAEKWDNDQEWVRRAVLPMRSS